MTSRGLAVLALALCCACQANTAIPIVSPTLAAAPRAPRDPSLSGSPAPRATPTAVTSFPPNAFVMPGDVSFVDEREGWIGLSDLSGTFTLHTSDGGRSWERLPAPGSGQLQFIDHSHGWLAGSSVYSTVDGGRSWQLSLRGGTSSANAPQLGSFSAVDATHAWITVRPSDCDPLTCGSAVLRTTDGFIWEQVGTLPASGQIQFVDRATGWATVSAWDPDRWNARSNEASILMTRDGGRTWARRFHAAGAQPHFDLSFVDLQHGWALGGDWSNCSMGGCGGYSLYRTTDGGDHWETIQSPDARWWGPTPKGASAAGFVGSLVFDDQRNGWLVAGTGAGPGGGGVLVSHDGGDHWMRFNGDGGVWSVRSIGAIGRDRAWATVHVMTATGHEMAVVMTADGGRTWQRQLSWPWSY